VDLTDNQVLIILISEKRKHEGPPPKLGKKKGGRGEMRMNKLPTITPVMKCRLKSLKMERIKDFLLLEEEFIKNQEAIKKAKQEENEEEEVDEEKAKVDQMRETPLSLATLEEFIDEDHAIINSSVGIQYYVPVMSFVDRNQLQPNSTVLCRNTNMAVVGIMQDETDPLLNVMKVEKAPEETYADVGGLEQQIQEIKEAVELPLTHPEVYEDLGIKPPKGVILYGEPGTGKTLLVKAVAHETSATFLRLVGSELIQKYAGDGPKLVRELFRVAEENAPSIVFIDEIDAIGTKRYNT